MVKESASNTPKTKASKRMLPKQVTRNVTNAEVGSIVLGVKSFQKNGMNKEDEKKPPKTATAT